MLYNLQSWLSAFSEYSNYFVFSVSQEMMFTSEKKDWEKLIITPTTKTLLSSSTNSLEIA